MSKMRVFSVLLVLFVAIALFGCGDPKIDTTSDELMKASIEKVRQSLPQGKKDDFDEAMNFLLFDTLDFKELFSDGATEAGKTASQVKDVLNGKSGIGVIAAASRIKKEIEEEKKVQALSEIKELEGKRSKAEADRTELAKFEVLRSRYYKRTEEIIGTKPIIELTVKNGTDRVVSRASFKGTLASPYKPEPWVQEEFNYQIAAGIQPGQKANWSLAPNIFSKWGTVKVPKDAILTVEVLQVEGPDGEVLFSTKAFSEEDAQRLQELKETYGDGDSGSPVDADSSEVSENPDGSESPEVSENLENPHETK